MQTTIAYRYQCLVPFHLADPAGILFFGNAFTLVHQAFEHFVVYKLNYSWKDWFQNPEWIVPIRQAEAQYLQPVFAGQECQIDVGVQALSHSSFTLLSSIQQNGLCCSIQTVHVFCDRKSKQKMAMPPELVSHLKSA